MQNRTRSSLPTGSRAGLPPQAPAVRAGCRSSTLRRAGSHLSADTPLTPPHAAVELGATGSTASCSSRAPLNASGSTAGSAGDGHLVTGTGGSEAVPGTPPEECDSGTVATGLTPASLKHLRRQNAKLTEEKDRLVGELDKAQALLRELRERFAALEVEHSGCECLVVELREARAAEEAQRKRAEEAERLNARLEESLATKEAEVARLRQALEDQLLLTKEVCEAAERNSGEARAAAETAEQIARLNEQVAKLTRENDALRQDRDRKAGENADLSAKASMATDAAQKIMALHQATLQRVEALRMAKLAEAIQHKVELHISVPRVTLSYNNAPPLTVSAASALSDGNIKSFLDTEVLSHFEPLWVTLDGLDESPDGTSKKAYATRMLDRLTEAVKGFLEKSQKSDTDSGLTPSTREPIVRDANGSYVEASSGRGVRGSVGEANSSTVAGDSAGAQLSPGRRSSPQSASSATSVGGAGGVGPRPRGGADKNAMESVAEVDREKLLGLLRSGDDRGLDSKLKELMQSRA